MHIADTNYLMTPLTTSRLSGKQSPLLYMSLQLAQTTVLTCNTSFNTNPYSTSNVVQQAFNLQPIKGNTNTQSQQHIAANSVIIFV